MPIYEYSCGGCGHDFDKLQRTGANAPPCPSCGAGETSRKVSLSSFHLKGSGWYASDYKASPSANTESAGEGDGGSDDSTGHQHGPGCGCH